MAIRPVTSRKFATSVLSTALVAAVVAVVAPLIGSTHIDYLRAWQGASPDYQILMLARLPRVMLSLIAGGTLAVAGVLFQALLRDALAEPYTVGVSSGASLGAVVAICFGLDRVGQLPGIWFAAFVGSGITLLLVISIAASGRRMSSFSLLLAGITMNSICLALILLLQNVATFGQSFTIVHWLMGGIDAVPLPAIAALAAAVLPAALFIFWKSREWNLLSIGEDWASARGVHSTRLLVAGCVVGAAITALVTALTGPIGFVGLIVPHALRILLGADHRVLVPCSWFAGAAFLTLCDAVARTVLAPVEIPVGVITALLGGPFFILLLRSKRRSLWL